MVTFQEAARPTMTNNIIRVGERSEMPDQLPHFKNREGIFCGGPVVKMLRFQCRGHGLSLIPGRRTKTPHATRQKKKKKKEGSRAQEP